MPMLAFGDAVLSRSIRARKLMINTPILTYKFELVVDVFTSGVRSKGDDMFVKLTINHFVEFYAFKNYFEFLV